MKVERICRAPGLPRLAMLLAFLGAAGGATWAEAEVLPAVAMAGPKPPAPDVRVQAPAPVSMAAQVQKTLVWKGADVDGDGQGDFANPTGRAIRATDAWGCGEFGAARDGGSRDHEGVDYLASPGQKVSAPISGYVSRLGEAYADSAAYRYVEITNPALHYVARVFYVDPNVREGQAVRLGDPIGRAHSLQARYPGITNHVHLEILRAGRRRIDAERLITASYEMRPVTGAGTGPRMAAR